MEAPHSIPANEEAPAWAAAFMAAMDKRLTDMGQRLTDMEADMGQRLTDIEVDVRYVNQRMQLHRLAILCESN